MAKRNIRGSHLLILLGFMKVQDKKTGKEITGANIISTKIATLSAITNTPPQNIVKLINDDLEIPDQMIKLLVGAGIKLPNLDTKIEDIWSKGVGRGIVGSSTVASLTLIKHNTSSNKPKE